MGREREVTFTNAQLEHDTPDYLRHHKSVRLQTNNTDTVLHKSDKPEHNNHDSHTTYQW